MELASYPSKCGFLPVFYCCFDLWSIRTSNFRIVFCCFGQQLRTLSLHAFSHITKFLFRANDVFLFATIDFQMTIQNLFTKNLTPLMLDFT